ncbi:MAG TPA: hypothetical protein PL037_06615 [Elusimicrobiales bacterium]|nr:hypothetical protein [Elusimicrobiales bacterium]
MSKKKKNRELALEGQQVQTPPAETQPAEVPQQAATAAADGAAVERPRSDRRYFFVFWSIIVAALAASWILAAAMPNVHESIIERWIMGAMAVSLAIFLIVFK